MEALVAHPADIAIALIIGLGVYWLGMEGLGWYFGNRG